MHGGATVAKGVKPGRHERPRQSWRKLVDQLQTDGLRLTSSAVLLVGAAWIIMNGGARIHLKSVLVENSLNGTRLILNGGSASWRF